MPGARTASSVGMMEGAFFVSRTELLQWVNDLLQLSLTKVEQCATGAVYCQILDACHPGQVLMKKVNWMAKADHEYIPNYKVLQAAFDKLKIEKNVDVDKLIRAKYQDNLEFLQWMKCYWDRNGDSQEQEYEAVERREGKPVPPSLSYAPDAGRSKPAAKPRAVNGSTPAGYPGSNRLQKENQQPTEPGSTKRPPATAKASPTAGAPSAARVARGAPHAARSGGETCDISFNSSGSGRDAEMEELKATMGDQQKELDELERNLGEVQQERDFYFGKLRQVEILCSSLQSGTQEKLASEKVVEKVLEILYSTDEEGPADEDEGP